MPFNGVQGQSPWPYFRLGGTVAEDKETPEQALVRALNAAKFRRFNEACGICRDVLLASPNHSGALGLLGGILAQDGRNDEAIAHLEAAIARQPGVANWHLNLCGLYRGRNQLDRSLAAGLEAAKLGPDLATPRVELALTYLTLGQQAEAATCFREAMAREPENPSAHMGLGELLLAMGEYPPGWLEYAWRMKLDQARGTLPKMTAAPWNGMRLPGGRILLVADQGFGDMIQFARFIPRVRERCDHVIVGWGPEVTALLGAYPGVDSCIPTWNDAPPHDAYCLLSSLPQIFGVDLDTIPAATPYMTMKPDKVAAWRARLDAALPSGRPRVGVAWSGRPTHPNNPRRSMPLATLAPILNTPDIDFVALQKPFPPADRAFAETLSNWLDLSGELADFGDTGAVIASLDLVISADTAVVHLAGALDKPAWVLVPMPADWRWLLGREDTPWYPTLRLFRQEKAGDWGPVIARVAAELKARPGALPLDPARG